MTAARLSLLVSTKGRGVQSVPTLLLPQRDDVAYVVVVQYDRPDELNEIPDVLRVRPDVTLVFQQGKGLSRSRNCAIAHCQTPYALLADDDMVYRESDIDNVIRTFHSHPETDVFCFQILNARAEPYKHYPKASFTYARRPYGYFFNSPEIGFRVQDSLPRFDERFGLGAPYLICGEEEVFLHDSCRKNRLQVDYYPVVAGRTTRPGTGQSRAASPEFFRSKGAVLYQLHGVAGACLRMVKQALLSRSVLPPVRSFKYMIQGMLYIVRSCASPS